MSDGAGPVRDLGAELFARGGGGGGGKGAEDGTNEKSIVEPVIDEIASNIVGLAHFLHIDLKGINNGAQSGFEAEGVAGKSIPSVMTQVNTNGGFWAKLLHAVVLRNRELNDQTGGVGGGANIEGSHGGEGFSGGGADFSSLVGPPGSYGDHDWTPASRGDLGTFSPPNVGDGGGRIHIEGP